MSYYYLILLIITTSTFMMSEVRLCHAGRVKDAVSVFFIFFVVAVHFVITWYKMAYHPEYSPVGIMQRIDIASTTVLIPLLYLYICHQFGVKLLCASTYCILGSLVLCCFTRLYLVIDDVPPQTDIAGFDMFIFYKGKALWHWNIYESLLVFQSCVMWYKILKIKHRMTKRNWSLSYTSNRLFCLCIGLLFFTILVDILNQEFWNAITTCIYITTYAILICALLQMVAMGYDLQPVIDVNKEPQYLEVHPKFEKMGMEFEHLLKEKQIFLNGRLNIEDVAKMLGTNRTYVTKMVKETQGESFTNVINRYRLEFAKQYMRENPDMKLEIVASESGFGSTSAFSKVFKDSEGVAPSQWK